MTKKRFLFTSSRAQDFLDDFAAETGFGFDTVDFRGDDQSTEDRKAFLEHVNGLLGKNRYSALVSGVTRDSHVGIDADLEEIAISHGLPFIGPKRAAFEIFGDKLKTKQLCDFLNISRPEYRIVENGEQDFSEWNGPSLVKSVVGQGAGIGQTFLPEIGGAVPSRMSTCRPSYVEKFIPGLEISINLVAADEDIFVYPSLAKGFTFDQETHPIKRQRVVLSRDIDAALQPLVEAAVCLVKAAGFEGILEAEFIVASDRSYLIEVNPRNSGSLRAVWYATGINPYKLLLTDGPKRGVSHIPKRNNTMELPLLREPASADRSGRNRIGRWHIHQFALDIGNFGKLLVATFSDGFSPRIFGESDLQKQFPDIDTKHDDEMARCATWISNSSPSTEPEPEAIQP